jgi:hypothetical protein
MASLASDSRNHATESTRQPVGLRVVCLVGVQLVRASSRSSSGHLDGCKRVEHRFEHPRIVHVRRREGDVQWDAVSVDEQVVLRAQFAPVRRVGPSRLAPPFAGTLEASSEARDQSISPRLPSSSRMTSYSRTQMPASFQSRSRRQHVMPLPQPISFGRYSHGIPVLSTKRIPVSTARSGFGGRPPRGFGFSAGSSGSIRSHSASGTSGFAMGLSTYPSIGGWAKFC